ncbi:type 1 glutamine amidotransferase domain-containing protein [Peredibacter starrii]|uniref:Type 1 glutamine amidotransferase domain-containing protein n=1 Tax=Peredibacter starrii TaxID=28202 RepID=A0AAX4HJW9_9BACT|nr:type 1 glutamine amidotransferase domain-containing protein [Peredibacter starrii]WPU63503.1 type 1 glutamine amidotransferase domain-containing protein [Peredibacter starrii]
MKIAMVLTSHDQLGNTGKPTGFWLEEFASPYYVFKDAGAEVTLLTPKGGQPPLDPKSDASENQTESTKRFKDDTDAQRALASTKKLSDVRFDDYDAVFYPGGHGPMWDLANNQDSIRLIETMVNAGKPVAAVCHGPVAMVNAKDKSGAPLLKGKTVTGFTDSEEEAVGLTKVVPFLLEDAIKDKGANYQRGKDWGSYVVEDGNIITGQNPASSADAAEKLLNKLH